MNDHYIIGNVGADPEVKEVSETKVANFNVATSKRWKNKDGEKQEKTEWHRCVAFAKHADLVEKYIKRGDKIALVCEVVHRSYDKDGEKKYITEDVVRRIELLGSGRSDRAEQQVEYEKEAPKKEEQASAQNTAPQELDNIPSPEEDDLPF